MRKPRISLTLPSLIGTDALTIYRELILAHQSISSIALCRYRTPPLLQHRIQATPFEEQIIASALRIRNETNMPFWESVFSACLHARNCSDSLLDAAMYHSGVGDVTTILINDFKSNGFERFVSQNESNVGLASRVELMDDEIHHFALMDFRCEVTIENTEIVSAVCRRLMPQGFFVLDSGDSYHACGTTLLTAQERMDFLATSLLFSPIVDSMYVSHQLVQPMSSIRISRGGTGSKCPEVLLVKVYD